MAQANGLEQRVAELERQVQELRRAINDVRDGKDWRRTIGMFAGDEVMKEIDEAGRRIREADRQKARRAAERAERRQAERAAAKVPQRKRA